MKNESCDEDIVVVNIREFEDLKTTMSNKNFQPFLC